jgi:hypothetical protein
MNDTPKPERVRFKIGNMYMVYSIYHNERKLIPLEQENEATIFLFENNEFSYTCDGAKIVLIRNASINTNNEIDYLRLKNCIVCCDIAWIQRRYCIIYEDKHRMRTGAVPILVEFVESLKPLLK